MKAPTTDQLRDRIDRGLAGDKVATPDPAAAPLGTDAEASGNPPTELERSMEAAAMAREPKAPPHPWLGFYIYLAAIVTIAVAAAWIIVSAPA